QPRGDGRRRDPAIGFLLETCRPLIERVAEVIVGERGEDRAQGIRLVGQRRGARREGALARSAVPDLDDLELLAAVAAADEVGAAAERTGLWLLARKRNASDAWNRR